MGASNDIQLYSSRLRISIHGICCNKPELFHILSCQGLLTCLPCVGIGGNHITSSRTRDQAFKQEW